MDDRTVEMMVTGAFPVLAWFGFIGVIATLARGRKGLALPFGVILILGLAGMLWASQTIFAVR